MLWLHSALGYGTGSQHTVDGFQRDPRQRHAGRQEHDDAQGDRLGEAAAEQLRRGAAAGVQLPQRPDPRHALAAACVIYYTRDHQV